LVLGRRPLGAILHSSNEPGELSQWLCHDDSTIHIDTCIIVSIIIVHRHNTSIVVKQILMLFCALLDFCHAMLCKSGLAPDVVMQCLSVCDVHDFCQNE